uniref:DDE Tnp4 domain-containing protein n=1 Tax=Lactuca sativa TaxID=4236 RepID=A0A9R1UJ07_LACSA|nr:hypothetical protein LSAT_V11C900454930 [Lactuca sativa]
MTRSCLTKLREMLHTLGGLRTTRHTDIDEQVAIFLHIIAHNLKNQVMIGRFQRSGETISKIVTRVCNAVKRLHPHLLKKPEPVTENSTDQRWKWFKNCLGALDGTHIKCLVPLKDKPKYRTRKNDIATNVLGVCSQDMQFIYVLPGWEGSAADGRVLRDALLRPRGLKVPRPRYYLVDVGYTNGEGFLAPYRCQRYHLNDWRAGHQPTTPKELFNMRHSSARNVIERYFCILKARWEILRDNSYYPIDLKNKIIMAFCLLHNYIRKEMTIDPIENRFEVNEGTGDVGGGDDDHITYVGVSTEWTTFRNNLAQTMCGGKRQKLSQLDNNRRCQACGSIGKYGEHWSSTHSVIAEPAVWDSYIQVHKEAGKWRNKIFPHYEDLCIIFGKDRAQGNKAKDFAQMEEDANNEEQSELIEGGFEEQTTENEDSPNIGSKKRKKVDDVIKGITIAANLL